MEKSTMPKDSKIPDLMSAAEAAEVLDMSAWGLRKAATAGRIAGQYVGNAFWVFRSEYIWSLAAGQNKPPAGTLEKVRDDAEAP